MVRIQGPRLSDCVAQLAEQQASNPGGCRFDSDRSLYFLTPPVTDGLTFGTVVAIFQGSGALPGNKTHSPPDRFGRHHIQTMWRASGTMKSFDLPSKRSNRNTFGAFPGSERVFFASSPNEKRPTDDKSVSLEELGRCRLESARPKTAAPIRHRSSVNAHSISRNLLEKCRNLGIQASVRCMDQTHGKRLSPQTTEHSMVSVARASCSRHRANDAPAIKIRAMRSRNSGQRPGCFRADQVDSCWTEPNRDR